MQTVSQVLPEQDDTMMTSSNGNIFRVTGHLCGEFTGDRWIPRTKASDAEPWCFFFICVWINGWVNNHEAGDLRRYRAHYDVIVIPALQMIARCVLYRMKKNRSKTSIGGALLNIAVYKFPHYGDVIMSATAPQVTSLTIVCSTVYSGVDQRKHQTSASLVFVTGIHRWSVNSPHKGPVTRKMFPFEDVIMLVPIRWQIILLTYTSMLPRERTKLSLAWSHSDIC